ncbi:hypothetical protein [Anaerobacillus alkaliphilus]|uniref:hypothetical protein n=1 Tax=Anaerobacillus alkaliphilus TaxID=1548597 RepID=UPI001375EA20|nr:hypothetical protein [Anaerobacillus alkaliphilus]
MQRIIINKRQHSTIEAQLVSLNKKYDELRRKMEEQQLENIQSDELLLKYLRKHL